MDESPFMNHHSLLHIFLATHCNVAVKKANFNSIIPLKWVIKLCHYIPNSVLVKRKKVPKKFLKKWKKNS